MADIRGMSQLFGRKNFRRMIWPLSIIQVRQSWDNPAKSIRQKKEHGVASSRCSSWRRPERYIGGGSVCGSKNDKQVLVVQRTTALDGPERSGDRPRNKIREGASLEEQARSD